jgi:hypothetical protein
MQQHHHHFLLYVKLRLDMIYTVVVIAIDMNIDMKILKIGMMPKQHVKEKTLIWQLLEAKTNLIV